MKETQNFWPHESNLQAKMNKYINGKEKNINNKIKIFYKKKYLPMRKKISELTIDENNIGNIDTLCQIINEYYEELEKYCKDNLIDTRSYFLSSYLEEINWYLFKDLPRIKDGTFKIYNKDVYLNMKFDENDKLVVDTKNVDFCIGKEKTLKIDDEYEITIRKPIVCVEVKTYTDAYMFNEIKSTSQAIKNGTPTARTYVLMGYNSIAPKHITNAKYNTALTEMFVLKEKDGDPIDASTLKIYWEEIAKVVSEYGEIKEIQLPGRLLLNQ